jgi:hypothetical protein
MKQESTTRHRTQLCEHRPCEPAATTFQKIVLVEPNVISTAAYQASQPAFRSGKYNKTHSSSYYSLPLDRISRIFIRLTRILPSNNEFRKLSNRLGLVSRHIPIYLTNCNIQIHDASQSFERPPIHTTPHQSTTVFQHHNQVFATSSNTHSPTLTI